MRRLCTLAVLFSFLLVPVAADEREAEPGIQMAILLDTSGSMEGLLNQARTELWKVVNDLIFSRRDGKLPYLEIALYEYGNNGLAAETGYIRQCVPFTDDLDKISEELFGLTTNGGDEFCGQVIKRAAEELTWRADERTLKLIYIAGNETFHQGPVEASDALAAARSRDIVVNTVHCAGGENVGWQEAATLGTGEYISIDQNQRVVHVDAPQDEEIARLGVELNGTYLAYGRAGAEGQQRQMAQDENALQNGQGSGVNRAWSKANPLYDNRAWDLCDGCNLGEVDLESIPVEDLPEEMREMTLEERKKYVADKSAERAGIQERINALVAAREQFVAEALASMEQEDTLGQALIGTVRAQAGEKGYTFSE